MPVVRHCRAGNDRNRLGAQMGVERFHQAEGPDGCVEIGMGAHREGMHPGIGAAGAMDDRHVADDPPERFLDMLLTVGPWACRCQPI